ncbi:MAG: cytochrome b [Pseudomonadota bacterium]
MKLADTPTGYGPLSVLNHWVIGSLVIVIIALGLMSAGMEGRSPRRSEIIGLHKSLGTILLLLAAWRIFWRLKQGFPAPSQDHPTWQHRAAFAMHWLLMIAILMMPLSGLLWSLYGGRDVSVFGLFSIPALGDYEALSDMASQFHRLFSKALISAIGLHALIGVYSASTDYSKTGGRMFKVD